MPDPLPTRDGTDTLFSAAYGESYHSRHGALTEARHVFLEGSGVADRLAAGRPTRLLEIGFGTGLNFLLTAQQAEAGGAGLDYVALEQDVLPADLLERLNHGEELGAEPLRKLLLAWRRTQPLDIPAGSYLLPLTNRIILTLLVGDASVIEIPDEGFHAVYLDAFSPDVNPELWTEAFLRRLHGAMAEGGALSTYSVKGSVRRALQSVGFSVEKRPGPPGKREMLVARRVAV